MDGGGEVLDNHERERAYSHSTHVENKTVVGGNVCMF